MPFAPSRLVALALVYLLSAASIALAQTPLVSLCKHTAGESQFDYPLDAPYPARTMSDLSLSYRSATGWRLGLVEIFEESSGALFLRSGACDLLLTWDPGLQRYISREGHRIRRTSPTSFEILSGDGSSVTLDHVVSAGAAGTRYLLGRTANRFGEGSSVVYVASGVDQVSVIRVDESAATAQQPSYTWSFTYTAGQLVSIRLSGPNGAMLFDHLFQYSGGVPSAIRIVGAAGTSAGSTVFSYRTQAPGLNLLERVTAPLGGSLEFQYSDLSVSFGGTTYTQPVVTQETVRAGVAGEPDVTTQYQYGAPVFVNSYFVGFSYVQGSDAAGAGERSSFSSASLSDIGLTQQVDGLSPAGVPVTSTFIRYRSGGVGNARRVPHQVVQLQFALSSSNSTTRGVEYGYNFQSDRLDQVRYLNQTGYDFTTGAFLNVHADDDVVRSLSYANDVPALGLWNRVSAVREAKGASGVLTSHRRIEYDAQYLPGKVREWDNVSKRFRDTLYQYDRFGRLATVARAGGKVLFGWKGSNLAVLTLNPATDKLTTTFAYDPSSGLLSSSVDPNGLRNEFQYDDLLRLVSERRVSSNGLSSLELLKVDYLGGQRVARITSAGRETTYAVDGFGTARKASESPAQAGVFAASISGMNAQGRTARMAFPEVFSMSSGYVPGELQSVHGLNFGYDDLGQLASITPDLATDGLVSENSLPMAPGVGASPAVNPQGRTRISGNGSAPSWYSSFGTLTERSIGTGPENLRASAWTTPFVDYVQDGLNNLYYEQKNSLGQVTELRGSDGVVKRLKYDLNGRLERVTWPSGRFAQFAYDSLGRITTVRYDNGAGNFFVNTYRWDAPLAPGYSVGRGQLAAIEGPHDGLYFSYDAFARIGSVTQVQYNAPLPIARHFQFEFEGRFGQISQIIYPNDLIGGAVTARYVYDNQGRELELYASPAQHQVALGLVRQIVSRTALGQIEQADYYNGLRELQHFSPTSGALTLYEVRRISNNALVEEHRHVFGQGRLLEQSVTIDGHTLREQYTQVDSRPFLRQIVRQLDNNPPQTIDLSYDAAGRPLADAKRDLAVYYNSNSPHPRAVDGWSNGSANYPWSYDTDQQLTAITGPDPEDPLAFTYGPDGNLVRAQRPTGERVEIDRGVIGDIIRLRFYDSQSQLVRDYRKFLFGLYAENTDATLQTTPIVSVFGETMRGEERVVAEFSFPPGSPFTGPSFSGSAGGGDGGGGGGGGGGSHPPPPPPPPPVPPLCPNGVVDPGEQCDGNTNTCAQPLASVCVACMCQPLPPPPDGKLRLTQAVYDPSGGIINEEDLWDILYAALTSNRRKYAELYKEIGIPIETDGPCDTVTVARGETSAPDITTADLIVLNLVAEDLACELGLEQQQNECEVEVAETEYEYADPAEMGFLDRLHLSLDVGGIADPTPVCDGANCLLYLVEFRFSDAGVSLIGFIPYLGDAAKAGRLGEGACRAYTGAVKIGTRVAIRVKGVVIRVVKRFFASGFWKVGNPKKVYAILGRFPTYTTAGGLANGLGGRRVFFDMADEYDSIRGIYGAGMTSALNREAMDIIGAAARRGDAQIVLHLNKGETLQDLFLNYGKGNVTKKELFHLSREFGLEVASNRGRVMCLKVGDGAVDAAGVPMSLKRLCPAVDWSRYGNLTFSGRRVPAALRMRLENGTWLKNVDRLRDVLK